MIIYNVTIKVDWTSADKWLQWMKNTHIPEVIATGCFEKHQLVRLLEIDETEGPTYAVQYYALSIKNYNEYLQQYAPDLKQKSIEKWGENFIAFRSLMQIENY